MKFGSLDGGGNGEHKCVDFVEISTIFVMQRAFLFETDPFDRLSIEPYLHALVKFKMWV